MQLFKSKQQKFLDVARNGDLDKVKVYIESGIDIKGASNEYGSTALHLACEYGHLAIVRYFIETCHVNQEEIDKYGRTALHVSSKKGHLKIVQYLIETCRVKKDATTNSGRTALHFASNNGHLNTVQYLIESCHVDMEAKNNYGATALDLAQINNEFSVVQYLEKARADWKTAKADNTQVGRISITTNDNIVVGQSSTTNTTQNTNTTSQQQSSTSNTTNTKTAEQLQREEKFLEAAQNGKLDEMKIYMNNGVNQEAKNVGGRTALHCASCHGHLDVVQYLIETCHVDKEAKDKYGSTALHCASSRGHLNVVQHLIELCHVDKESTAKYGKTALHVASWNGHLKVVQYLTESCHVNKEGKDTYGWTALHYASRYGHLEVVQYLIETCQVDTEVKIDDGQTAHDLARKNNKSIVLQYLEAQAKSITMNVTNTPVGKTSNTVTNDNTVVVDQKAVEPEFLDTAGNGNLDSSMLCIDLDKMFLYAARNGNLDKMKENIVHKEAKDKDEETALHYACENGHLEIVRYLIEKFQFEKEAKDKYGRTALHYASWNGHSEIVQCLVEECHVDQEAKDNDGRTALHYSIINSKLEIVQYLIQIRRVDIESKDNSGQTPYDIARINNKSIIVQYLEKAGADSKAAEQLQREKEFLDAAGYGNLGKVVQCIYSGIDKEAKDKDGETALHRASRRGQLEIVQLLIETYRVNKQATTNYGMTVLHCASSKGHLKMVQYLTEKCYVNQEAKNNNGSTALHLASIYGYLNIVRYFTETCIVDTETKDYKGRTALHHASWWGHLEIVQYLIQTCHLDKKTKDNIGWTVLHFASRWGQLEIVQYLTEICHVDIESKDNEGQTAYDIARKNNERIVVKYLEKGRINSTTSDDNTVVDQHNNTTASLLSEGEAISPTANLDPIGSTDILIQNSDSSHASPQSYKLNENWMSKLQDENQQFIDKLNELPVDSSLQFIGERRDILDLVCAEKCNTIEEQKEQSAILASPLHRDFYLLLQRKLKCMIKSCETLSTGMVGAGGGDFRSFTARTIRDKGCNVLHETKLGLFIGNAFAWASKNLAVVPFIDSVGSVFQLIVTLKAEHDRYLGLARVADFATMVCLQQYGTTSLDNAVEKLARFIVRARCGSPSCTFVEEKDEFGKFKQLVVKLLADSGNTPAKEQASKAADCAFAHIMKPDKGSILFDVLYGDTFDAGLDEALAASVLGITLEDLRELDSFSIASQGSIPTNVDTTSRPSEITANTANVGLNGTSLVTANTPNFELNGVSLHADSFASSEMAAKQEAKIQKQDEMIQKLSYQVAHLEKKIKHSNSRTNYDAGDGLMFANPTEQFKDEIATILTDNVMLDQRLRDQAIVIDSNESRIVDLEKQLSRLLPVIDTKGGTKKGTNRNRNS